MELCPRLQVQVRAWSSPQRDGALSPCLFWPPAPCSGPATAAFCPSAPPFAEWPSSIALSLAFFLPAAAAVCRLARMTSSPAVNPCLVPGVSKATLLAASEEG